MVRGERFPGDLNNDLILAGTLRQVFQRGMLRTGRPVDRAPRLAVDCGDLRAKESRLAADR